MSGELVDRLLDAINPPQGDDWIDFGSELVFCLGGRELDGVNPEPVNRDEFFHRLRRRLFELTESGVREDFLVRALRDELRAALKGRAWPNEARGWSAELRGATVGDSHERAREAWAKEERWEARASIVSDEVLARWRDEAVGRAAG